MKGIVFTKFLEMVEQEDGYGMVDKILLNSNPLSGGVYTAIGTYPHTEMVDMIGEYCKLKSIGPEIALRSFGRYLFNVFHAGYPAFFAPHHTAFDFLESIDTYIHIEVAKLYPDAQLPRFETERPDPGTMVMIYHSDRKMADLAYGLIEKTLEHFNEKKTIGVEYINDNGSKVKFIIK